MPRPIFLLATLLALTPPPMTTADEPAPRRANRLAREKSPYLLQHAFNPVDWYPWGDEAFARAAKENKPVLLSIGYATCHWCHVMERESFENAEIAKYLNDHFVAIKLDREERPDLDRVYMSAMQALGLGGGWPLNVFLTPERKPFFGGTYFPPAAKSGQPGFRDVLERIAGLWESKEKEIRGNADELTKELERVLATPPQSPVSAEAPLPGTAPLAAAAAEFMKEYDPVNGGFGPAPKFPQPAVVAAVLRQGVQSKDARAIDAAVHTLRQMAAGGMYDQLGDGFARYSVDERWLVPHFEKMLYDNAQLAAVYLDASLAAPPSDRARLADVARGIFRYVRRDLTSPDGAFFSAEDADSEGHEGKFYTWTKAELESLLSPEEAALAINWWGVTEKGNFTDHSRPDPEPNQNILSLADPKRLPTPAESTAIAAARHKLLAARALRVRPLRDDKVLGSWNGLMLSASARGAMVLDDDSLLATAVKNGAFLRSTLWDPKTRSLAHRWRDGETDRAQLFNSHAFVLQGAIDLYQATLDPQWLEWALELADVAVATFFDREHGGFFQGGADASVLLRLKEDYDDAEPSGNSVAVGALLQLAAITGQPRWREVAEKTLRFFGPKLKESPGSLPLMAQAAANAAAEPYRVVVAGDPSTPEARALRRAAWSVYAPNKVVLGTTGPVEEFARTLEPKDGKPTAFVCSGKFCHLPTSDAATVRAHLSTPPPKASKPPAP